MIKADTPKGTKVRINGQGWLGVKGQIAVIRDYVSPNGIGADFPNQKEGTKPIFLLESLDYIKPKYKINLGD
jgi:hypothetical protein